MKETPNSTPLVLASLVLFLISLVGAQSALAQDDTRLAIIDDTFVRMESADFDEIWILCTEVAALVDDDAAAREKVIRKLASKNPLVRLGAARILLDAGDSREATPVLLDLVLGNLGMEFRVSAIEMIEIIDDFIEDEFLSDVEDSLNRILEDENDPFIRIHAARALSNVSSRYAKKARGELKAAIESDNLEIKISGALALADIDEMELAKRVLRAIKNDPTVEGRLARTFLDNWKLQRYYINLVRDKSMSFEGGHRLSSSVYGLELISEIIDRIREDHILGDKFETKEGLEKLLTAAAKGMLNSVDPHSTYFSQEEHERWRRDLLRSYAGIGAYVDTIDGVFSITRPIYSGPAYKAGLRSGDQIWKVDGWETFKQDNDEIIRRLKGDPNTDVTITVYRPGWKKERQYTIMRDKIAIPTLASEIFPGDIAYLELKQFSDDAWRAMSVELKRLKKLGVKGLILDVRNNTGGYLSEAVLIASYFLDPGKLVVYTKGRNEHPRNYPSQDMPVKWDAPMVVLTNRNSASASEILAGALKYYKRALIVGDKTYGKGAVQVPKHLDCRSPEQLTVDRDNDGIYDPGDEYKDLNSNGKYDVGPMVKITTSMYFLPSDESIHTLRDLDGSIIHEGGIEPDLACAYEGIKEWKEEELTELIEKEVFKNYVDKYFPDNKELFIALAEGDGFDFSRYPDFEETYKNLGTHLDREDIRKWIRAEIRRKVADERGKAYPGFQFYGDYQEDNQLQTGIAKLLEEIGVAIKDIAEYRGFADKSFKAEEKDDSLSDSGQKDLNPGESDEIQR